MNSEHVLQIAGTRLAIRCNHIPFNQWLLEKYGSYVSQGDSHLSFNIQLDHSPRTESDERFLTITKVELHQERNNIELHFASMHPTPYFGVILQICLRCAIAFKQPPDLLLHTSGVVKDDRAYLFTGDSGAGKSTVCKLLRSEPSFTILHDETVAVTRMEQGFGAWSTPLRGEVEARSNVGAPLKAIFFLNQDDSNFTVSLSRRKAAELLCYSLIPPLIVDNGNLVTEQAPSLKQLLVLAEVVPCYELHFREERNFWDCIENLKDESVIERREGSSLCPVKI